MKRIFIIAVLTVIVTQLTAQEAWTLRRCIDHAIENNLTVQKQEVVLEQQELELHTSKYSRLPSLNGSASQNFNFGRVLNNSNVYEDRDAAGSDFSLSTSVPIFTGLQIPNNIALAKLNLKAATEDLNKVKEDIGINVTSSFLQVLFNMEIRKVSVDQVELSRNQLERISRLHQVGKASPVDVSEAKSRLAQDELSATQAANNLQLALLELSQLLELPSPEGFEVSVPQAPSDSLILSDPESVFNDAVMNRPAILAAQYRVEGAGKNINIARSGYYPKLSFEAGMSSRYYHAYGQTNNPFGKQMKGNFSQALGFRLSIPIFNRFEVSNRVKSARLQQVSQTIQLDETRKSLYKEIQQAYYNAVAAQSRYVASRAATQAGEDAFVLMKEKYENGKATFVEYNEVRMNLLKAASDRIQAKYNYIFLVKILDFYRGVELNL